MMTMRQIQKKHLLMYLGEALLGSEGVALVDVLADVVELTTLESSLTESETYLISVVLMQTQILYYKLLMHLHLQQV